MGFVIALLCMFQGVIAYVQAQLGERGDELQLHPRKRTLLWLALLLALLSGSAGFFQEAKSSAGAERTTALLETAHKVSLLDASYEEQVTAIEVIETQLMRERGILDEISHDASTAALLKMFSELKIGRRDDSDQAANTLGLSINKTMDSTTDSLGQTISWLRDEHCDPLKLDSVQRALEELRELTRRSSYDADALMRMLELDVYVHGELMVLIGGRDPELRRKVSDIRDRLSEIGTERHRLLGK